MAARMHNLRISSDHNYPVNIIQRFMDSFNQASKSSQSQVNDDDDNNDDDEFENVDEMQRRWAEIIIIVHVIPRKRKAMFKDVHCMCLRLLS